MSQGWVQMVRGQGAIHAGSCTRGICDSGYSVFITLVQRPGGAQFLDLLAGTL